MFRTGVNLYIVGVDATKHPLAVRLAAELSAERKYQRMTWPELAKKTGIGERALQRYLNIDARDWRAMGTDDLEDVCKALGIPPEDMFMRAVTGVVTRTPRPGDGTAPLRHHG